ncbi:hypothetical protein ACMZ5S_07975, partial [Streptococcus pluranimalium]
MAIPLTITEIEDKVQYLVNHPNLEIFFYDFLSLYQFPKATLTRLRKEKGNHIKNKVLFEVVKGERSVVAEVASLEASLKGKKSIPRYLI